MRDSGGGTPKKGAEISLLFSVKGVAYLYAADASECVADPGTYSYAGGRLSLYFQDSDFRVNKTFALSLAKAEVTMPFQVLSAKPGTSLWKQEPLSFEQGVYAIFNAADNVSTGNPTPQGAAGPASDYAEAWVAASSTNVGVSALERSASGGPDRHPARSSPGPCTSEGGGCIKSVVPLGTDIQVYYTDGSRMLLSLYTWPNSSPGTSLQWSPLAGDPRIQLDPTVHPDGKYDPTHKTAVFIAPYTYLAAPFGMHSRITSRLDLADMASKLESRGYKVTELLDADATIKGIANALKTSPGFVLVDTHGDNAGDLETSETVEGEGSYKEAALKNAVLQETHRLLGEDLKSLVDYGAINGEPTTFELAGQECSYLLYVMPSTCSYVVTLTPMFWRWLQQKEGASFAKSLVFIAACSTDKTVYLRLAVRAEAYFAFSQVTSGRLCAAVGEYLVDFLARPTRSPEEAYYNMRRIQSTRLMIYKEDDLFDGLLWSLAPAPPAKSTTTTTNAAGEEETAESTSIIGNLDGWGYNGKFFTNYQQAGWLSPKVDQGQVWWMLFAGRWDTNALNGAQDLKTCLDTYWLKGETGGLADQFCNSAQSGQLSNKERLSNDVAYAMYLLDGIEPAGFDYDFVPPRWTMDDSGKN
ncbi:MAG: hypothetical protein ACLP81_03290 [Acidimicrobiales bacterium]